MLSQYFSSSVNHLEAGWPGRGGGWGLQRSDLLFRGRLWTGDPTGRPLLGQFDADSVVGFQLAAVAGDVADEYVELVVSRWPVRPVHFQSDSLTQAR